MKRNEGITLVALVVTIVVLLILAGITIVYVFGDNGVFKLAQDAKNEMDKAKQNEQEYFNNLDNVVNEYVNKYTNGTGGGITNPPVEDVPVEQIKSDWATIEKIAKEIARDETITSDSDEATVTVENKKYTVKVGDIFEVKYNEETRRVRVLGFKHDDLVDQTVYGGNHSKASISFEFLDFMIGDTYMSMNSSNTNSGGWAATQMRKDLNGYSNNNAPQSGAIGGLGANLSNKAYIKQVTKKYIGTYNSASSVTTCNDYLWLLAASEVVNNGYNGTETYGYAITSEGSQYKYYQGVTESYNANSTSRVKYNGSGSAYWWWLRSPGYDGSTYFCIVGSTGNANGGTSDWGGASGNSGVAPGFSI